LVGAGLSRMWLPDELGGPEADPLTAMQVIQELSQADGSVGWCVMIACQGSALAGAMPRQTADAIFADPAAVLAGATAIVSVHAPGVAAEPWDCRTGSAAVYQQHGNCRTDAAARHLGRATRRRPGAFSGLAGRGCRTPDGGRGPARTVPGGARAAGPGLVQCLQTSFH